MHSAHRATVLARVPIAFFIFMTRLDWNFDYHFARLGRAQLDNAAVLKWE
jgi:hypothetical protein